METRICTVAETVEVLLAESVTLSWIVFEPATMPQVPVRVAKGMEAGVAPVASPKTLSLLRSHS